MLIFILLIVVVIGIFVVTADERHIMKDCDKIAQDNDRIMRREIEKSNEEWKRTHNK